MIELSTKIGLTWSTGPVFPISASLAPNVQVFMISRFLGGLGIGTSTIAAPMFISEIASPKYRRRLAGMFQFNIVFGILMAYLSNTLPGGIGDQSWRWMLGVQFLPAMLFAIFAFGLPESPGWLIIHKKDREEGLKIFSRINPQATWEELEKILREVESTGDDRTRIFQITGMESQAALLQSVGIGITNLIFTFIGLWLIDRLGRRTRKVLGAALSDRTG